MCTCEDLDFADDIALLSHTDAHMQGKTDRLASVARTTGLEINVGKTKFLRLNAIKETSINVYGQEIEEVDHFTYLGSNVSKT